MTGQTFLFLLSGIAASAVLTFAISRFNVRHPIVLLLFTICVLAVAYTVARRFTRPLRNLAAAAGRFGDDINSEPLPEVGPTEVREAAVAFNAMQNRIRDDFLERTAMLAAITHDLQTPLTRLRLRLEKVNDETLRAKLVDDLSAMRATVGDGLDLARSLDEPAAPRRVDLDSILSSICDDAYDAGQDVTCDTLTDAAVLCAPNALRRCLTNLTDNAVAYGRFARIAASVTGGYATVRISDGGPGVPEEQIAHVFEPFYRLEPSRSRDTGGSGLGLTIARNTMRRFGGDVDLANGPSGGLVATVRIPLA